MIAACSSSYTTTTHLARHFNERICAPIAQVNENNLISLRGFLTSQQYAQALEKRRACDVINTARYCCNAKSNVLMPQKFV